MTYKEEFLERVKTILKEKDLPIQEERNVIAESMIEEYYETMGKIPPSFLLELLGDYVLADTLRDMNTYKVSHEENPVLSDHQQKRRKRREVNVGDQHLDFFMLRRRNNPNTFKVQRNNTSE